MPTIRRASPRRAPAENLGRTRPKNASLKRSLSPEESIDRMVAERRPEVKDRLCISSAMDLVDSKLKTEAGTATQTDGRAREEEGYRTFVRARRSTEDKLRKGKTDTIGGQGDGARERLLAMQDRSGLPKGSKRTGKAYPGLLSSSTGQDKRNVNGETSAGVVASSGKSMRRKRVEPKESVAEAAIASGLGQAISTPASGYATICSTAKPLSKKLKRMAGSASKFSQKTTALTPSRASPVPATSLSTSIQGQANQDALVGRFRPKSQGKPIERRVLPQRIRRAAAGGVEGMRDVEEMIVDWVQRWAEPVTSPPDNLSIHVSSLPITSLDPPPSPCYIAERNLPSITVTHSRHLASTDTTAIDEDKRLSKEQAIETPGWVVVATGEDDVEEAKEELREGEGRGARGHVISPLKRLRRIHDESEEDTSDAFYTQLHRKYEAMERRQRLREKEMLQFERYKMSNRIELLRNMSKETWASVVGTILSNGRTEWEKGKEKLDKEGEEWLRRRLLMEGEELMKRYDELLPPESRKRNNPSVSSQPSSPRMSTTSEPSVLPARVVALRESFSNCLSNRRKRGARMTSKHVADGRQGTSKKAPKSYIARCKSQTSISTDITLGIEQTSSHSVSTIKIHPHPSSTVSSSPPPLSSPQSSPRPISIHPVTLSGTPCLLEAASRRESALEEAEKCKALLSKNGKGRLMKYEKTRTSERLGAVNPFGMPLPGTIEYKSEFTLTDEEEFWPIIAKREEDANNQRRTSLVNMTNLHSAISSRPM
ncbi:hypothetical protein L204_102643 [Cryptococcus depauperatus]|nr:hypothetical protein L204_00609 [Cryptococcus depauperatus CBS 7855]